MQAVIGTQAPPANSSRIARTKMMVPVMVLMSFGVSTVLGGSLTAHAWDSEYSTYKPHLNKVIYNI